MTRDETIDFLRRYLKAVEDGATGQTLAVFFTPDVILTEHPNAFAKDGAVRDLAGILAGAERGQALLASQSFSVRAIVVDGARAMLTLRWEGTLKVAAPAARLTTGQTLSAEIAQHYEFRDGRIARQETFDCYTPW